MTGASSSPSITALEKENAAVSRLAAADSIVLLKNNGVLPLEKGSKIALYGEGAEFTIKGGIGSGEVNCRRTVSIREGLESAGYILTANAWLDDYRKDFDARKKAFDDDVRRRTGLANFGALNYLLQHPFRNPEGPLITEQYLDNPEDICLYVISRQAGENTDRQPVRGDFLLSEREEANLRSAATFYHHLVLVINAGGSLDLSLAEELDIDAIIFLCQPGQEAGFAFADVLSGDVTPSGHLSFSWIRDYRDIPFGEDFSILNGNTDFEEYREGIYIGYRYFDTFGVPIHFPFGHGLSYTSFSQTAKVEVSGDTLTVTVSVTNIGHRPGKAVAQIYASCPEGKLEKELKRLAGFAKTSLLAPGEMEKLTISFSFRDLASFDPDVSAFLLEPGDYILLLGENVLDSMPFSMVSLPEKVILSRHKAICPVTKEFEELTQNEEVRRRNRAMRTRWSDVVSGHRIALDPSVFTEIVFTYNAPKGLAGEEISRLQKLVSAAEVLDFLMGDGLDIALPKHHDFMVPGADAYTPAKYEKRGIPAINFCDGPAGLRLFDVAVRTGNTVRMGRPVMESFARLPLLARKYMIRTPKEGKTLYQYTTAFPSGMSLGQSWSRKIMTAVGHAMQKEMEAFGAEIWLAPGINLYRNPLCGRNYEYYSEDPVLSGHLAASLVQSVQDRPGFRSTVKHFVCNNQEINRRHISENIYPRPLRELYLKNFEIAIKEGQPQALMTSYNKVNGTYVSESRELITDVVRNEWGYQGLIMTDWTTDAGLLDSLKVIRAGVNMLMPGIKTDRKRLLKAFRLGEISEKEIRISASYVFDAISKSRLYRR